MTTNELCICGLIQVCQKNGLLSPRAITDLCSLLVCVISEPCAGFSFSDLRARIDSFQSLSAAGVSSELSSILSKATTINGILDFVSSLSSLLAPPRSAATEESSSLVCAVFSHPAHSLLTQPPSSLKRPYGAFGHFLRKVIVEFNALTFRQVFALARSLSDFVSGKEKGDASGPSAEDVRVRSASDYAGFAAAVARGKQDEAIDFVHAFVDRDCYGSGSRRPPITAEVGRVLLPFGDLMIANVHFSQGGHLELCRRFLAEAFEIALEWYSEQAMAEASWLLALATPRTDTLAHKALLFRSAFDQAAKYPGGAFQKLNCALSLAIVHATIPPSMTLSPILQCNLEPSPVSRSLSHITIARAAAAELSGDMRSLAEDRIRMVESSLWESWGRLAPPSPATTPGITADSIVSQSLRLADHGEHVAALEMLIKNADRVMRERRSAEAAQSVLLKIAEHRGETQRISWLASKTSAGKFPSLFHDGLLSRAHAVACSGAAECRNDPLNQILHLLAISELHANSRSALSGLGPALLCHSTCSSLELRTVGAQADLCIANALLSTQDATAGRRALHLIDSACASASLPPKALARAHFLRAKCFIRETPTDLQNRDSRLRTAVAEMNRSRKLLEKLEDFVGLAEVFHTLALVCHALGWTKLRNDTSRRWKHAVSMIARARSASPATSEAGIKALVREVDESYPRLA